MGSSLWHSLLLTSINPFLFLHFHVTLSSSFNLSSSPTSNKLCSPQQSLALLQFKKSTTVDGFDSSHCSDHYPPHPKTESWKEDTDCCSWEGVSCDNVMGDVVGLDLSSSLLSGTIHDNSSLFLLHHLQNLILACNNFSGQPPSSVFNLTPFSNLLMFDFSYNFLSGRIPFWLFTLPSLLVLRLQNNRLTGPLPSSEFETVNIFFLDLSSNNLSDIVAPDTFSMLPNLIVLCLSRNSQLSLTINFSLPKLKQFECSSCNITDFPIFLRNTEDLEVLDLSNNSISGHISQFKLGLWPNLHYLDLSHNLLTSFEQTLSKNENPQGPLLSLPTSFLFFSVSNNKLTGEIPSVFCNMSYIQLLLLSSNGLTGTIPRCLGNNNLTHLDLRMNNLHGSIPQSLATRGLEYLLLNGNYFEGPLPSSFVNCSQLQVLDVGNNNINDTFPHWVASLPNLQILILGSNRFRGPIVHSNTTFSFPKLRILDLSNNRFNGHLPTRYFDSFKAMMQGLNGNDDVEYMLYRRNSGTSDAPFVEFYSITLVVKGFDRHIDRVLNVLNVIDMSDNLFEGEIPGLLGKLNSLKLLNFSHNKFTGHIPSSLENLTELEALDLSSNKLVGEIPEQLTSLTDLSVLNLSYNQLVGPIPQGKQFNTFEYDSFVGNSELCGIPLSKNCDCDKAREHEKRPTTFCEEDDTSSWFDWEVAMMGYGCGLVAGLSTGYIVFTIRKPQWFVRMVDRKQLTMARRFSGRCRGRRN